jgi:5'-3' exonuclease
MGSPIALVDLSWVAYTFRHTYKDVVRFDEEGRMWPVGHVYGCIRVVQELSFQNKIVLLAVDSAAPWRYEALPGYKSGRHQPTGDPFEDYKIMTDLVNILKICTFRKNVMYVKHPEMESDDIITSIISSYGEDGEKDLSAYFNDNDILQVNGRYVWFNKFGNPPMDRRGYLKEKYGLDLEFLPVFWKVVRGDASDRIPVAIPRFPGKLLVQMCQELGNRYDFEGMLTWLQSVSLSKAFMYVKDQIKDTESDLYKALSGNWKVVVPRILDVKKFNFKRFALSFSDIQELLVYYQIRDYVPVE